MAPVQANIWGYTAAAGEAITVHLNGTKVNTVTSVNRTDGQAGGMWTALLPAQSAGGPYTLEIQSGDTSSTLQDVLFGDVWVCSGQSNMAFAVSRVS